MRSKKIEIFGEVKNEIGVIMIFSKIHEQLGFSKFKCSSHRGFDIDEIDYKGKKVTLEFEFLSQNFENHGHVKKMEKDKFYVVVCWNDNCNLKEKINKKNLLEVIELRDKVKLNNNLEPTNLNLYDPIYVILSYNKKYTGNIYLSFWKDSNLFRIPTNKKKPKFSNNYISPGSKILLSENGFIVGGFTVVRYEVIDKLKDSKMKKLYKILTDYPMTQYIIDSDDLDDFQFNGHIFYRNFTDYRSLNIPLKKITNKKMPWSGKINITSKEYNKYFK